MANEDKGDVPFTHEELAAALAEELGKLNREGDGWVISNVTLDGEPVELPGEDRA
jgi:hypothetical protein